jgi:hypothetical protein
MFFRRVRITIALVAAYFAVALTTVFAASAPNRAHAALFLYSHFGDRTVLPLPAGNAIVRLFVQSIPEAQFESVFVAQSNVNAFVVFEQANACEDPDDRVVASAYAFTDLLGRRGIALDALDRSGCTPAHRVAIEPVPALTRRLFDRGFVVHAHGNPTAAAFACKGPITLSRNSR